jgi:cell volume regulation protein A
VAVEGTILAVPVVLATFPVIEGVPRAHELFAIAFFAVLLSTVVQGTTFEVLARRLKVTGRRRTGDV